jgi:short-subunit dehydrogenase
MMATKTKIFAGKHVAITGASAGIGEALARRCAEPGARLTLVARREDRLQALATELRGRGAEVFVHAADLSQTEQMGAWIDAAERALGPIDVAIANAGIQLVDAAIAVSDAEAERQLAINVVAPQRMARRLGQAMAARGAGHVVIISSLAAINHVPGMADYSATKAAVAAYFETLRVELAPRGVHVLTVYPGPVHTEMETAALAKLETAPWQRHLPTGTPDELANLVAEAIARRTPRIVYPRAYAPARHLRTLGQWLSERFAPSVKGR